MDMKFHTPVAPTLLLIALLSLLPGRAQEVSRTNSPNRFPAQRVVPQNQHRPAPPYATNFTRPLPFQTNLVLPPTGNTFSRPSSTFSRPASTFEPLQTVTPRTNLYLRGTLFGAPVTIYPPQPAVPKNEVELPLNTPESTDLLEPIIPQSPPVIIDYPPGTTVFPVPVQKTPIVVPPSTPPPIFVAPSANFAVPVQPAPVISIDLPPGSTVRR